MTSVFKVIFLLLGRQSTFLHFKTLYNGNWASDKFVGIIKTCGTQEGSQSLGLDMVTLLQYL